MYFAKNIRTIALSAFAALALSGVALAQTMPDQAGREMLIKQNLMTFNDANLTGNYSVMRARSSKPFFDELPESRLSELFAAFREQAIDLSAVTVFEPVYTEDPVINADGLLHLAGYFDTRPSQVLFELEFFPDAGEWKIIAINVNVRPPDEAAAQ